VIAARSVCSAARRRWRYSSPVLRRGVRAALLEQGRVLPRQPLDLRARFGEDLPAGLATIDRRGGDADSLRRLRQLAQDARFQRQQRIQPVRREDGVQEDARVRAADAVDAAVPLHQPHRVPGQVVVDDVPAVLPGARLFAERPGSQGNLCALH
jgi:hypothetical protein